MDPVGIEVLQEGLAQAHSIVEVLKWVIGLLLTGMALLGLVIIKLWNALDKRTERFTRIMAIAVSTLKDLGVSTEAAP